MIVLRGARRHHEIVQRLHVGFSPRPRRVRELINLLRKGGKGDRPAGRRYYSDDGLNRGTADIWLARSRSLLRSARRSRRCFWRAGRNSGPLPKRYHAAASRPSCPRSRRPVYPPAPSIHHRRSKREYAGRGEEKIKRERQVCFRPLFRNPLFR